MTNQDQTKEDLYLAYIINDVTEKALEEIHEFLTRAKSVCKDSKDLESNLAKFAPKVLEGMKVVMDLEKSDNYLRPETWNTVVGILKATHEFVVTKGDGFIAMLRLSDKSSV